MVKDIILNDENDLQFSNGDFVINDSDQQHVLLILNTNQGSWKQYPLVGVGIRKYLNSSGQSQVLRRSIAVQLEADGYNVNDVIVQNNDVYSIDANRLI